jgi:hypothetical protein
VDLVGFLLGLDLELVDFLLDLVLELELEPVQFLLDLEPELVLELGLELKATKIANKPHQLFLLGEVVMLTRLLTQYLLPNLKLLFSKQPPLIKHIWLMELTRLLLHQIGK